MTKLETRFGFKPLRNHEYVKGNISQSHVKRNISRSQLKPQAKNLVSPSLTNVHGRTQ